MKYEKNIIIVFAMFLLVATLADASDITYRYPYNNSYIGAVSSVNVSVYAEESTDCQISTEADADFLPSVSNSSQIRLDTSQGTFHITEVTGLELSRYYDFYISCNDTSIKHLHFNTETIGTIYDQNFDGENTSASSTGWTSNHCLIGENPSIIDKSMNCTSGVGINTLDWKTKDELVNIVNNDGYIFHIKWTEFDTPIGGRSDLYLTKGDFGAVRFVSDNGYFGYEKEDLPDPALENFSNPIPVIEGKEYDIMFEIHPNEEVDITIDGEKVLNDSNFNPPFDLDGISYELSGTNGSIAFRDLKIYNGSTYELPTEGEPIIFVNTPPPQVTGWDMPETSPALFVIENISFAWNGVDDIDEDTVYYHFYMGLNDSSYTLRCNSTDTYCLVVNITDGDYKYRVDSYDGINITLGEERYFTRDDTDPVLTISDPINDTLYHLNFENITTSIQCTDDNIITLNYTFYNSSHILNVIQNNTPVGGTLTITEGIDISAYGAGDYNMDIVCSDIGGLNIIENTFDISMIICVPIYELQSTNDTCFINDSGQREYFYDDVACSTGIISNFTEIVVCDYCTPEFDVNVFCNLLGDCSLGYTTECADLNNSCYDATGLPSDFYTFVGDRCTGAYDAREIGEVGIDFFMMILIGIISLASLIGLVFVIKLASRHIKKIIRKK